MPPCLFPATSLPLHRVVVARRYLTARRVDLFAVVALLIKSCSRPRDRDGQWKWTLDSHDGRLLALDQTGRGSGRRLYSTGGLSLFPATKIPTTSFSSLADNLRMTKQSI
ncbi:hypothetical protein ACMFMG_001051 [Clarireedia jacksonii]